MAKIKTVTLMLPITRAGDRRMRTGRAMVKLKTVDFKTPQFAFIRGQKLPVRPTDWRVEIPAPIREQFEFGQKIMVTYVEYPIEFEEIGVDKKGDMIYYDKETLDYVAIREPDDIPPEEIERQPQLEEDFTFSIDTSGHEDFVAEITGTIRHSGLSPGEIEKIENTIQKEIFDYIKENFDASKKPGSKRLADTLIKSGVEYGVTTSPATDFIDITIEKTKERAWTGRFRVKVNRGGV